MNTAAMTQSELELALAERLSVPCPACHSTGELTNPVQPYGSEVLVCNQCEAGRVWPLRETCRFTRDSFYRANNIIHEAVCGVGCPGWAPTELHMETLLALWPRPEGTRVSWLAAISLISDILEAQESPTAILEAAERALLEALAVTDPR